MRGLNLGCGDKHLDQGAGWLNVDIRPEVNPDEIVDLGQPWPWPDREFDRVWADNVLEHFAPQQAIFVLNEIGRVLKDHGLATIIVPHFQSQGAVQDPTHKSFYAPRSALYWSSKYTKHGGAAVGITAELVKVTEPKVYGDMATEAFIRFELARAPR